MIRRCVSDDFDEILDVINEAAHAYEGVIPEDRWHDPYMPVEELRREIEAGVAFWGHSEVLGGEELSGVMGIQVLEDVALIRHAYVRTGEQRRGIGSRLLEHLEAQTHLPLLVGTWAAAEWAVRFYERHGFRLLEHREASELLRRYWVIPERQVETSVVLADESWRSIAP